MAWNVLFMILFILCSEVFCKIKQDDNTDGCFFELKCGGENEFLF